MRRHLLWFTLTVAMIPPAAADERETVVLLHGVALSGWVMRPIANELQRAGYRTVNISYPSRTMPFEDIASTFLPEQLRRHGVDQASRLHFVTHSMGSLVVRLHLAQERPHNLGRVVMLGPPNHGSAAADRVHRYAVFRWIFGRNLSALGLGDAAITRNMKPANFEVGIIAGSARINPLFDADHGGETHDGVVTVTSARLEGMSDFIVLPHSHTIMLWRRAVIAQVLHFLRTGAFAHPAPPSPAR